MNVSGDAAESVVRMSLEGTEVVLRLTGSAAKNIAALLYALYKDKTKTKGKTSLNNLLKSGKELKVFSIKKSDLKTFQQQAKQYGVLYSALINKNNKNWDGMVDIMVRAEDAPKINRIVKRFDLSTYDQASIKNEISKDKKKQKTDTEIVQDDVEISENDKVVDEILYGNSEKDKVSSNKESSEKKSQSKSLSENNSNLETDSKISSRKSVREELKEIKIEQQNEQTEKNKLNKTAKHQQPNKKKRKKSKGGKSL